MILSMSSDVDSFVQFVTVLIMFVFVCILTYFSTRFIGSIQKGQMNCSNIDVVETFKIAPNKYIQIVRVGDKYVAIAVCKDTVEVITQIDKESLQLSEKGAPAPVNFKSILEKAKQMTGHDKEDKTGN